MKATRYKENLIFVIVAIICFVIVSPVSALEDLSDKELQNVTAQIATAGSTASDLAQPIMLAAPPVQDLGPTTVGAVKLLLKGIELNNERLNLQTTTEPVKMIQTLKLAVSFGFF